MLEESSWETGEAYRCLLNTQSPRQALQEICEDHDLTGAECLAVARREFGDDFGNLRVLNNRIDWDKIARGSTLSSSKVNRLVALSVLRESDDGLF